MFSTGLSWGFFLWLVLVFDLLLVLKLLLGVNALFLLLVFLLLFVNWFGVSHSRNWYRIHKASSRPWQHVLFQLLTQFVESPTAAQDRVRVGFKAY